MNSKERVLAAINFEKVDRIPMDFTANKGTLSNIKYKFNLTSYKEILKFFNADILDMRGIIEPYYQGKVPQIEKLKNGVIKDYWGMKRQIKQTNTGPEEMYVDFIFKDIKSIEEIKKHHWPDVNWFDFSDIATMLKEWKNFAIMASGVSIFQHPTFLRGIENLLIDMVINKEIAHFLMDKFTEFYLRYFDKLITEAKGQIDILRIADDLGMQDRPLISDLFFTEFFKPRLKKIIDMAHSHGVKVMFHSCGSITNFIKSIIELEVDVLDPIQVRAKGMNPKVLKKLYGKNLCFHGSIDTQYILPKGCILEVKNEVEKMINILGKNSGFILAPSHILQTDVPLENILTLYKTGIECNLKK